MRPTTGFAWPRIRGPDWPALQGQARCVCAAPHRHYTRAILRNARSSTSPRQRPRFIGAHSLDGRGPHARRAPHRHRNRRPAARSAASRARRSASPRTVFLSLPERPARVAVAGSGYIAVELAGILAALGSKSRCSCRGQDVLNCSIPCSGETALDDAARDGRRRGDRLPRRGSSRARRTVPSSSRCTMGGRLGPLDTMHLGGGPRAQCRGLGLDAPGVISSPAGYIDTDDFQATNVTGIYALGDVTGRMPLTPVAIAAGRRLRDRLFGGTARPAPRV